MERPKHVLAGAVALVASLALLAPVPAASAATGDGDAGAGRGGGNGGGVTLESPRRVRVGWRGPIRLRGPLPDDTDDYASFSVVGPRGYRDDQGRFAFEGVYRDPWYADRFPRPGTYRVSLRFENSGIRGGGSVRVLGWPPSFVEASTNRSSFHPRVRDGFQDGVTVRWRTSRRLTVSTSVVTRSGRVVRRLPDTTSTRTRVGTRSWDGRSDRGGTVPVGRYRIRMVARDGAGQSATRLLPVRVRPGR